MQELPEIVIESALNVTDSSIYLGYIREQDLPSLPKSDRIIMVQLETKGFDSDHEKEYQSFSQQSFYQIVQYKWALLNKVMTLGHEFVIYSDTDVYWNLDPIAELESTFDSLTHINLQIQSFTDSLLEPKLCMGFVALRNVHKTVDFLKKCEDRHRELSLDGSRIGDDDVVTLMFKELGRPNWLIELPQTTFPVGRMLKLYAVNSIYPGIGSPVPFIFHANYVIGLKNKILLLRVFIAYYAVKSKNKRLPVKLMAVLILKHSRFFLVRTKSRLK